MSASLTIAFDADDTIWHNENAFADAEQWFNELVAPWADSNEAQRVLVEIERDNVGLYGYGVKSFALSMISAACTLSNDEIDATSIASIVTKADELLAMPTRPITGAIEALAKVSAMCRTMIITKGDLHHQRRRIDAAGVAQYCFDIEVVAEKDAATYRQLLRRHQIQPDEFVMIGNSIVSDVVPVIEIGGRAVHIPYEVTWALETAAQEPEPSDRWFQLRSIQQVPSLIASLT